MRTIATDQKNDFIVENGNFVMLFDNAAVLQESKHFAATLLGEMIHAIDKGVPYLNETFSRAINRDQFERRLRNRILEIAEIKNIKRLDIIQNDSTLNYTATLDTIYGEVILNG